MDLLYITADVVGQPNHGGGQVTGNESAALAELGSCEVWGRQQLKGSVNDPWSWDLDAHKKAFTLTSFPKLAHFYAGTFPRTVGWLKVKRCKISYTAAAHCVAESLLEHKRLGIPFNYPHLTDPDIWRYYLEGYKNADCLIVPSTHSAMVMREYGCKQPIHIIPHGIHLPTEVKPPPEQFTVGYLGAYGPDKGVRYLLEAWNKLNYKDATLLLAGGQVEWVQDLVRIFAPNSKVVVLGWVESIAQFYNSLSLYIQPSVTEGFGIEVLEAMSYNRPVLCSETAGASDVVPKNNCYSARDVNELANLIHLCKEYEPPFKSNWRSEAEKYTWPLIRERYKNVWKEMLGQ